MIKYLKNKTTVFINCFIKGIVYEINKDYGNCSIYGLADDRRGGGGSQTGISVLGNQNLLRIRTPNEFFRIDNNIYPVGEVFNFI